MNWTEIFQYIPPTNVALILVIVWLFRCLEKKDNLLQSLGDTVHRNSEVTNNMATLINVLVARRTAL